ncbi:NAD(P)H-quinone oxidoreductase subunit J [Gemmatirosa kalamazoonensis]|uniref:NADH-quinone oxidoreductase subunit C n=1 Tax=Gemmatirosa kalamazoonensis TaxID=861299 RepID=W0RKI5_9BACT|nr:NADH-quinone oxidoreductase subunit C [Gemmatirosa kalamazoonensis]AHG90830.1 NAD(P)H-quinone oxidoreductase subunit J [Gemmatirosa kalamazoonensis]
MSANVYFAGSAAPAETPRTPRAVPHRGGEPNPSAAALQAQFPGAVQRVDVIWGETTVVVETARVQEIVRWLHDDASQRYDYLSDVTAVEFRDTEQPIEVVWHLRSLPYRRFLRLKALLSKTAPLQVPSVWPIYKSADWLERECFDMFGITFDGHPDLRRILMWENYREGFPLRKDFPLRGRFSRAEQLRQTLAQNPEARYSMEEISIAEAFSELPEDMRRRLGSGERTGE